MAHTTSIAGAQVSGGDAQRHPHGAKSASRVDSEKLLLVLSRYISRSTAKGLVERTTRAHDASDDELVEQLAKDASLFTDEATHRKLVADLRSLLAPITGSVPKIEAGAPSLVAIEVKAESDLLRARSAARELATAQSARDLIVQKVVTIVSELARNMLSYAGGGEVTLLHNAADRSILVKAVDQGKGIKNLTEILEGRYKSRTGLGLGILGTKRLASEMRVHTGPTGTTIEAKVAL